jgi:hypothetical protein
MEGEKKYRVGGVAMLATVCEVINGDIKPNIKLVELGRGKYQQFDEFQRCFFSLRKF